MNNEQRGKMGISVHVLIVEDSEDDTLLLVRELQRGGYDPTFERVDTAEAMKVALDWQRWDIVISDYSMPRFSALAALTLLRESELDLPFIVVSGAIGEETAVAAMRAGAHDYLMKDNLARLGPAVQRELQEAEVRLARWQAEEEVQRRTAQLEAVRQVGLELTAELDLDVLLHSIMSRAVELLGGTSGGLYLYQPEQDVLMLSVTAGSNVVPVGTTLHQGEGLSGRVWETGEPLIVDDYQHWERRTPSRAGYPNVAIVGAPIRWGAEFLGVLNVRADPRRAFSPADAELLGLFATQAAIAIRNARLYATEKKRAAALARALEQQQELDRLKNELIQNVSHELRTPLGITLGYAELLESGELGELQPEQQEAMTVVARRARMLKEMMDDFIIILEAERRELKPEQVDLADLIHTLMSDFQAAAEQVGLALAAEVALDLPPLFGDPHHLRRVLDNLLGNALKFTPAGGTVTVRLWRDEGEAVLEVADTGVGIPRGQLDRIFERFYQVDGSTSRRYGGTGLGLALVKEVIEAHSGTVGVESEPGRGSTFTVRLPLGRG